MVSAAALAKAKSMLSKQTCSYGGYRASCSAGKRCLHRHYDDDEEAKGHNKSYLMRRRGKSNEYTNENNQPSPQLEITEVKQILSVPGERKTVMVNME